MKYYKLKCFFSFHSDMRNGFTLLELIISLTIVGLIVVIVFGSFRVGARAWEKGEKDVEVRQRQRIVLELIRRQLASACIGELEPGGLKPFFLKGENKSIEFISRVPMVPFNKIGMVYVKYFIKEKGRLDKESLLFYEQSISFPDKKKELGDLDDEDFAVLITGVGSISFEYLKGRPAGEALEWQKNWDPETDEGLPLAVKIIFEGDTETSPIHPIQVISRIRSEVGQERYDQRSQ